MSDTIRQRYRIFLSAGKKYPLPPILLSGVVALHEVKAQRLESLLTDLLVAYEYIG